VQTPARTSIRFLSTRSTKNMYGGNRIASTSMPKNGDTHAGNGRGGRDVCGERNKQIIRGSYRGRTKLNARDMKRRVAADCPRMPIVNGNGPNGISDYWRYAKSTRTEVNARARARALSAVYHVTAIEETVKVKSRDCEFFIFGHSLEIASRMAIRHSVR